LEKWGSKEYRSVELGGVMKNRRRKEGKLKNKGRKTL